MLQSFEVWGQQFHTYVELSIHIFAAVGIIQIFTLWYLHSLVSSLLTKRQHKISFHRLLAEYSPIVHFDENVLQMIVRYGSIRFNFILQYFDVFRSIYPHLLNTVIFDSLSSHLDKR